MMTMMMLCGHITSQMMNISEYIQICPVSLRIHIQTWPNIMITLGSGEDLVPEQENEVEEQQRARTAGSGEKMVLPCSVFTDIFNLIYFNIFSILPCCVFLDISN